MERISELRHHLESHGDFSEWPEKDPGIKEFTLRQVVSKELSVPEEILEKYDPEKMSGNPAELRLSRALFVTLLVEGLGLSHQRAGDFMGQCKANVSKTIGIFKERYKTNPEIRDKTHRVISSYEERMKTLDLAQHEGLLRILNTMTKP